MPNAANALRLAVGLCTLTAALPAAYAQPPGQCRMSVSESRIDYGVFARAREAGRDVRVLRRAVLTVACQRPTRFALALQAAPAAFSGAAGSAGSSASPASAAGGAYGFGPGTLSVRLAGAQADGRPLQLGLAAAPGVAAASAAPQAAFAPGQLIVLQSQGQAVAATSVSAWLEIEATLPAHALQTRDATVVDATAALRLIAWPDPPMVAPTVAPSVTLPGPPSQAASPAP